MFRGTKEKRKIIFRVGRIQTNLDGFLRLWNKGIALGRNCFWAWRTGTLGPTWPGITRMKPPGEKVIVGSSESHEHIMNGEWKHRDLEEASRSQLGHYPRNHIHTVRK